MRAMILAAGRGERMRPLTDTTPKPLLEVNGKALIEYHLEQLAEQGVERVVINHAWLGDKIEKRLGNGRRFGFNIVYSAEPSGGLETAGGIIRALPYLGTEPFWVINGDIFTDFDFAQLPQQLSAGHLAHLLLTQNPPHNQQGDFTVKNGLLKCAEAGETSYTYTGMGLYSPEMFSMYNAGSEQFVRLRPFLDAGAQQQQLAATIIDAAWTDVGTPERLAELQEYP